MKKVNVLILGLAVLLAFGCSGDEKKDDPIPEDQVQKNCLLTKIVSPETTYDLIYNSAGKVIRINDTRQDSTISSHMEITYNAGGNIAEIKHFNNKNATYLQEIFSYNSQNLPDTIYSIYSFQTGTFNTYEYNAAGQLTKWSNFSGSKVTPSHYTEVTYPAPNQTKEMLYSYDALGNVLLNSTYEKQYDNKKSPHAPFDAVFKPIISSNNLLSFKITNHSQGTTLIYTYTYIYNAADYPIQQAVTYSHVPLPPAVSTFTYNCQ
ncbi:hypothetical protein [Adhaeribacter terreus]|uniref:YD repeat-containing protein n=1 Tax=Adhaeribacter terreus TaxID=529703 RepID=A0ABW0EDX5_9BACT